jgi:hypothetical protein
METILEAKDYAASIRPSSVGSPEIQSASWRLHLSQKQMQDIRETVASF